MGNSLRAADAAVRVLEEFGVRYAFCVPGESFLGLLDALAGSAIQVVAARHEGGAAFMAEAVGKLTGMPALCMGTRGVGSSNLAVGIHTAHQDSTPMLAMLGQVETPFRHREAFQEVELAAFLGELTKWAVEVPGGERLPDLVAEGVRRAVTGRPGPVALALRGDILDEPAPGDVPAVGALPASAPRAEDTREALRLLAGAKRPLVIAGEGVLRDRATDALVRLAERTGLPVVTGFRRHDAFPNDHPLYLGSLSIGAPPCVLERARAADVVLALGSRLDHTTTQGYTVPAPGAALIQAIDAPESLGQSFPARLAIAAGAGETIEALLAAASEVDWPDRSTENRRDREAFVAATTPPAASTVPELVDPALVIAEMQRQLPADAVITTDAGNFYTWLSRYYRFRRPGTFLGPISGAMGYAVPSAVAAALVRDSQVPVVACAGDGGFMMTGNELAVAAQLGLRVTCLVFDNAMYGTIRMHQEREYPGRVSATELWSPNLARYAEAFGGIGIRIDDDADVADGLRAALEHPGIAVVQIAVSREAIAAGRSLSAERAG
ncbi:MAG TPA: thiamine pyrophosphate-dependent enzyme [Thermomicrobiaceae bacterium]|nr:thiamine pyrophosphate-dependent enzyme [Thermomicrobiaceae bacterium]